MTSPNLEPNNFSERDNLFLELAALQSETGAAKPDDLTYTDERVIDTTTAFGNLLREAQNNDLTTKKQLELRAGILPIYIEAGFKDPGYIKYIIGELISLETLSLLEQEQELAREIGQRVISLRRLLPNKE